jgi:hypothetical protein
VLFPEADILAAPFASDSQFVLDENVVDITRKIVHIQAFSGRERDREQVPPIAPKAVADAHHFNYEAGVVLHSNDVAVDSTPTQSVSINDAAGTDHCEK